MGAVSPVGAVGQLVSGAKSRRRIPFRLSHAGMACRCAGNRIFNEKEWCFLMIEQNVVLCGANSYEQKYYFNEQFSNLPEGIRQELQIMCVLYTEDVGGILTLEFEEDGSLEFKVTADESDYLFDEIGSVLKIKQYQREKRELLEALEMYYRVFYLGEEMVEDVES